jgi:nucleoside-diphosphate-sugar epimerase
MKNITIAGASGFVGKHILKDISDEYNINCLSRSKRESSKEHIKWKEADLYSLKNTIDVFENTDIAIYLVHSMLPASKLFQGNFQDTDLIIADNFIHACKINNVKKIIYLGGVISKGKLSPHLESRKEVENVIINSGIDYVILRCGMIVGDGGSSFEILTNLCKNLPFMVLPKWTENHTQIVHIDDLVKTLIESLDSDKLHNKTLNVTVPQKLTYKNLICKTKQKLNQKFRFLAVPINYTAFSKRWVSLFGHTHMSLVSPLIDSLCCDLKGVEVSPEIKDNIYYKSYEQMLDSIDIKNNSKKHYRKVNKTEKTVRSIQRIAEHDFPNVEQVAEYYFEWLPEQFKSFIYVEHADNLIKFRIRFVSRSLLDLKKMKAHGEEKRVKFHITGGLLTKTKKTGWLEFRSVDHGRYLVASINDFQPSLPWYIYCYTQALFHKRIMHKFAKDLKLKFTPHQN